MNDNKFNVYFNTVGRSYENALTKIFENKGCSVVGFNNSGTKDVMDEFVKLSGSKACLMLHISNDSGVSAAIKLLAESKEMENKSIILMSTFQTWAGKRYGAPILNVKDNFCRRVASQAAGNAYLLENGFYNASRLSRKGCILGIGLIYGDSGFDFETAFTSLWKDCDITTKRAREQAEAEAIEAGEPLPLPGVSTSSLTTTILSDSNGSNRVPMVHIEDLATQLFHLASVFAAAVANSCSENLPGSSCGDVYFAASDVPPPQTAQSGTSSSSSSATAAWTLAGLFHNISEKLNRVVKFTSQSEVMEMYFSSDDQENSLLCSGKFDWLQDISFVSSLAISDGGPSVSFAAAGAAVFAANGLNPPSHPPSRDKTSIPPVPLDEMTPEIPILQYPNGLCASFTKIWNQFLAAHKLVPCVVLVTGPSFVQGKVCVVEEVARHLDLAVLDPVGCVIEVVDNYGSGKNSISGTSTSTSTDSASISGMGEGLRGRIIRHLEAASKAGQEAAAESAKGGKGKGKAADAVAGAGSTEKVEITSITEETVKTLPRGLIHQCVAFKIYSGVKSGTYKGCVLDISWDSSLLIKSTQDLLDIFTCKDLITLPPTPAGRRGAGGDSSGRMGTGRSSTGSQATAAAAIATASKNIMEMQKAMVWPDLVVEIQCDNSVILRKQMLQWGVALDLPINKLSKDQQAAHAALESAIHSYKESLEEIGSPPKELPHFPHVPGGKPTEPIDEHAHTHAHGDGAGLSPRRDKDKEKEAAAALADPNSKVNRPYKTLTHPVILSLEHIAQKLVSTFPGAKHWMPNVFRSNITPIYSANGNNAPISNEEVKPLVFEIIDKFVEMEVHGPVGWYKEPVELIVEEPGGAGEGSAISPVTSTMTACATTPVAAAAATVGGKTSPMTVDTAKKAVGTTKPVPAETTATAKLSTETVSKADGPKSARGRTGSRSRSGSLTDGTKPQTPREHGTLTRSASTAGSKSKGKDAAVNPDAVYEFDLLRIGEGFAEPTDLSGGNKVPSDMLVNMEGLNAAVQAIADPAEKEALVGRAAELQKYLVANVLTHAAECLIIIARTRPEDPIRFFYDFLLERGAQIQSTSEAQAFQNFIDPLSADEVRAFYASRGEEVPEEVLARARRNDEEERVADLALLQQGVNGINISCSGSRSADPVFEHNSSTDIHMDQCHDNDIEGGVSLKTESEAAAATATAAP